MKLRPVLRALGIEPQAVMVAASHLPNLATFQQLPVVHATEGEPAQWGVIV